MAKDDFKPTAELPKIKTAGEHVAEAWATCPGTASAAVDESNPKDLLGIKKPQLWLVPSAAIIGMAMAMANGAKKYGPYNWRTKKVKATVYVSACERHLRSYLDGENVTSDSGVHPLDHAMACLAIVRDAEETGNLVDDRPAPGAAARMIDRLTTE